MNGIGRCHVLVVMLALSLPFASSTGDALDDDPVLQPYRHRPQLVPVPCFHESEIRRDLPNPSQGSCALAQPTCVWRLYGAYFVQLAGCGIYMDRNSGLAGSARNLVPGAEHVLCVKVRVASGGSVLMCVGGTPCAWQRVLTTSGTTCYPGVVEAISSLSIQFQQGNLVSLLGVWVFGPPPTPTHTSTTSLTATASSTNIPPSTASLTATTTLPRSNTLDHSRTLSRDGYNAWATNTLSRTVSATVGLAPPVQPPPVLPGDVSDVTEATGTIVAVGVVASGPSAAVVANRGGVSLQALRCHLAPVEQLSDGPEVLEHPLRIAFGGDDGIARYRGAVACNVLLCWALGGAAAGASAALPATIARYVSFIAAACVAALVQPTVFAALVLALHDTNSAWPVVGLCCCLVLLGGVGIYCAVVHRARPHFVPLALPDWSNVVAFGVCNGLWVRHDAFVTGAPNKESYAHTTGRLHEDYRGSPWWMLYELGFSVVLAVFSAVFINSLAVCQGASVIAPALFVVHLALNVRYRYRCVLVGHWSAIVTAVMLGAGSVVSAYVVHNGLTAANATVVAYCVVCAEIVAMVAALWETAAWFFEKSETRLQDAGTSTSDDTPLSTDESEMTLLANPLLLQDAVEVDSVESAST